ncbi:hypothetical protein RGQ29_023716 [Quercus rubra]|uniref:Uncharacterized protein n=1 Tax=Quercus rubra TaxID=3512 RepID=A0AAN7FAE6_QUERU|nr:hypothetical protein RGQ29_023716 [Quercus rubra]
MDHLDNETNKVMAMVIIESIMKNYTCISTAHQVEVLFELIKGLIKDLDGTAADELIRQLQGQDGDIAREEVPNGAMAALIKRGLRLWS